MKKGFLAGLATMALLMSANATSFLNVDNSPFKGDPIAEN
jgi:hypothetical protein